MVIIILTWYSVNTWGAPLTSISLMLGVTLARVDIVSLNTINRNSIQLKVVLPQVECGHYEEVYSLLNHSGLMPHSFLLSIFLCEYWLKIELIIGQHRTE